MYTRYFRSFVCLFALVPLAACASTAIGIRDDASSDVVTADVVNVDTPPARLPDVQPTHCAAPPPVAMTGSYQLRSSIGSRRVALCFKAPSRASA